MAEKKGELIVISGPSGTGKGTLIHKLQQKENIAVSISCTTRTPRAGEKDGKDYYFLTDAQFDDMLREHGFLEYADVFGKRYGTPKDRVMEILNQGRDVILEIDVQGAMQVKKNYPKAHLIFILPPSEQELLSRLSGRGTETKEQIQRRFSEAQREISFADQYDEQIVNEKIEDAVEELEVLLNRFHQEEN